MLGILMELSSRHDASLPVLVYRESVTSKPKTGVKVRLVLLVGSTLAEFAPVSHCYRRNPNDLWPFNLYTMIHATSEEECHRIAARMSAKAGVGTYSLLFSRKELKKTSMAYFADLK